MTKPSSSNLKEIDALLSQVGDFSKYQIILIILFSFINILSAFHYYGQTFTTLAPEFKCNISSYNFGKEKNNIINITAQECSILIYYQKHNNNNNNNVSKNYYKKSPCTTGWIYNTTNTEGFMTIIQELNWVCTNNWKPVLGQSVFFMGSVIGGLILGILSDNIGRLHVLIIANMFAFFGNGLTSLSNNAVIFSLSRFIAGFATDTNFVMMYIIVMEYLRPTMRTFGLNICIGVFYSLSCMAIPWIAAWIKNWRIFLIIISIFHLFVLLFYFIVPESAQWLISKGRTKDAIICYEKIARINGKLIEPKFNDSVNQYAKEHFKNVNLAKQNLLGLLKTPNLRKITIILTFKSIVLTLCYDAISKNISNIGFSPFIVFTISSSTIFPACIFILFVQDRIGRKALASSSLLLSGSFSIFTGLYLMMYETPVPKILLAFALIARFGINIAYNSGHQYTVELLPTVIRGQAVTLVHVIGYGATFFSSEIIYLSNFWRPSPEILLGILMISGAIVCLFLPETLNKTLPITLEDGEKFAENNNQTWNISSSSNNKNID